MAPKRTKLPIRSFKITKTIHNQQVIRKKTLSAIKEQRHTKLIQLKIRIKGLWYNSLIDCKAKGNFVIPKMVNELRLL